MDDLKAVCAYLRGDSGCPWDREQTFDSLKSTVLEESYEVIDAINDGGLKLADELGDLLFSAVNTASET